MFKGLGRRLFIGYTAGALAGGLDFIIRYLIYFNPALIENYRLVMMVYLIASAPYILTGLAFGFAYQVVKHLPFLKQKVLFPKPYVTLFSVGVTLLLSVNIIYATRAYTFFSGSGVFIIVLVIIAASFGPAAFGVSKLVELLENPLSKLRLGFKRATAFILLFAMSPPIISSYYFATDVLRREERPFICILLIDALRADHCSCYGHGRKTTPEIDEIASAGILFEECYAQSSWTRPSVASMFTGLPVAGHKVTYTLSKLPLEAYTLPEALEDAGYTTIGCSGTYVVSEHSNLDQGFDFFFGSKQIDFLGACLPALGTKIFDKAYTRYLSNSERVIVSDGKIEEGAIYQYEQVLLALRFLNSGPTFVYIHSMEPHLPYVSSPRFRGVFGPPITEISSRKSRSDLSDDEVKELERRYDCCIRQNDFAVGVLYDGLKTRGFLDDALVVITADHGEEFYDHGMLYHAKTVYRESVHVPLILLDTRDSECPPRYNGVVGLTDLAPTILEWSGASFPEKLEAEFIGSSLFSVVRERERSSFESRIAVSEIYRDVLKKTIRGGETSVEVIDVIKSDAVRNGRFAVVRDYSKDTKFVFNMNEDPYEQSPMENPPPEALELETKLNEVLNHYGGVSFTAEYDEPDEELINKLKELGYIE